MTSDPIPSLTDFGICGKLLKFFEPLFAGREKEGEEGGGASRNIDDWGNHYTRPECELRTPVE